MTGVTQRVSVDSWTCSRNEAWQLAQVTACTPHGKDEPVLTSASLEQQTECVGCRGTHDQSPRLRVTPADLSHAVPSLEPVTARSPPPTTIGSAGWR